MRRRAAIGSAVGAALLLAACDPISGATWDASLLQPLRPGLADCVEAAVASTPGTSDVVREHREESRLVGLTFRKDEVTSDTISYVFGDYTAFVQVVDSSLLGATIGHGDVHMPAMSVPEEEMAAWVPLSRKINAAIVAQCGVTELDGATFDCVRAHCQRFKAEAAS